MIQIMKNKGWLVVAAALTIGLSACSSDEIASGEQTQQAGAAQTISVTVGAGFDADASTRSDVIYDETAKTRTLTFTKGDRLFVEAYLFDKQTDADNAELTYYDFKIAGLLTMVENSLSSDGKTAQFSGELTLLTSKKVVDGESTYYKYEKSTTILIDFEGKDPLSEAKESSAVLIHEDGVDGEDFTLTDSYADFTSPYVKSAADVKTLMTTKMYVSADEYDADNKSFKLKTYDNIIFNCAIDGLAASTSYKMVYCYKTFWSDYDSTTDFQNSIKTDASGKAVFAFAAYNSGWVKTHAIKFIPLNASGAVDENGEVMIADIIEVEQNGLKEDMVYNISRTATSESGSDGKYLVYDKEGGATAKDIPSDATVWTGTVTAGDVSAGTYVVDGTATCNGNLTLQGDIDLILKDGASLTVSGKIAGGQSINIYGQSESTGKLSASGGNTEIAILAKNLTVHGGIITVPEADQGIETGGVLTVYNGTINTTGDTNGFMILGGMYVYGGEITATSTNGAAISLYKEESSEECDLTITGGKVTATSEGGPGIDASENIIISGGTVKAIGGLNAAGIGCLGDITISGGTITAISDGPGIGAGDAATCGNITISGGTVIAMSSADGTLDGEGAGQGTGAGIGVDGSGKCGAISITGGSVTATGGQGAAGIGSSFGGREEAAYTSITISGGEVTATRGADADSDVETRAEPIGRGEMDTQSEAAIFSDVSLDGTNSTDDKWLYK